MKKVIASLLIIFAFAMSASAQTDSTSKTKYFYYPSLDVYFNDQSGDYWYYDKSSTKWTQGKNLPSTYKMNNDTKRYEIWYNGSDVWKANADHRKQYPMTSGQKSESVSPQQ